MKHYLRWSRHGDVHVVHKATQPTGKDAHRYKHGLWNHPDYQIWRQMMNRCYNQKDRQYRNYGGRGIKVCERWHDIRNFVADMGDRPEGHSIERINNDIGYQHDNCLWIPRGMQARNRRCNVMTQDKADKMRSECRRRVAGKFTDGLTRKELADKYECSVATVKKVLDGNYWR